MYGLPKGFDASEFVGQELVQICFTANTISLAFDGDVLVTLLSSFGYSTTSNEVNRRETVPVSSSDLMHLIGKSVRSASAEPDGTLTLVFQDGATFTCLDDSREYESYSIHIGDREIIV